MLGRCLDDADDDAAAAAAAFTARRADDARALVRLSRGFDGPGKLGTARFLLPLIVDSLLHRALPALFTPPVLRAMQDERRSFAQLARRKQLERAVLLGAAAAAALSARALLPIARRLLGA